MRLSAPGQDVRKFSSLAAGCNTEDYATVAPPAGTIASYTEAVANSCTDSYDVGGVPAKAQGWSHVPCTHPPARPVMCGRLLTRPMIAQPTSNALRRPPLAKRALRIKTAHLPRYFGARGESHARALFSSLLLH